MLHSSASHPGNRTRGPLPASRAIPFLRNWPLHIMIIVFLAIWVWLAIWPVVRRDWLVENILLAVAILVLALLYRRIPLSNFSYLLLTVFFILHTVGAHYAYKNTPVDFWFKRLFPTGRDVYDRLVHLAFGLLVLQPLREVAVRVMRLQGIYAYVVPFMAVLAFSGLFEIGELGVVLIADPKLGEQYLGLQGDPLDTPKDMSMTLFGALAASGLTALLRYWRLKGRDSQ